MPAPANDFENMQHSPHDLYLTGGWPVGMICSLRRVNEDDIRRLLDAPEQVKPFLLGPEEPPLAPARGGLLGFLLRLTPISIEEVSADHTPESSYRPEGTEIDIDKAWHGLHFLFTGTAWEGEAPASFLLCGMRFVGSRRFWQTCLAVNWNAVTIPPR
jgi:hypothetical protein